MNENHVLADEVLDKVNIALSKGNNWMAYNTSLYFIDKNDIQCFNNKDSAKEFADNNLSERDRFSVIHIFSIQDLFNQIPYGYELPAQTELLKKENNKQLLFNTTKTNVMNQENLEYLKNNIKYMGFGEKLNDALQSAVKEGKPEFQLDYKAEVNKKPFEATLHFRKSDNSDMYFFNSYQASLHKFNDDKVDQTFYMNKGKGFTMKEAFNLLDGRSVNKELTNKEGQPYNAWVQLDFEKKDNHNNFEMKQFHENYGFDLKGAVSKYSIPGIKDPKKEEALIQSLQKGNMQAVNIESNGSTHLMFIEANPQFKSINLYDGQMKRVQKEDLGQYQSNGQLKSKEVKQEATSDIKKNNELKPDVKGTQDATKENKQGLKKESQQKNSLLPKKQNSNGLLQKKRTSSKKGLAV